MSSDFHKITCELPEWSGLLLQLYYETKFYLFVI